MTQSRSASFMASLRVLRARLHRHDLGAEHLHAEDVRLLPLDVDGAHVDDAFEAEAGAQRRRGDAVLAGAGLGDDALLAHAPGEQDLAEHVVHLVGAGVVQLLALEVDLGAAEMLGQALGEIERARPADIVGRGSRPSRPGRRDRPWRRRRPPRARGSAASASRRRSGRRTCRNGRARPARCGRCWAAATTVTPTLLLCSQARRRPRARPR